MSNRLLTKLCRITNLQTQILQETHTNRIRERGANPLRGKFTQLPFCTVKIFLFLPQRALHFVPWADSRLHQTKGIVLSCTPDYATVNSKHEHALIILHITKDYLKWLKLNMPKFWRRLKNIKIIGHVRCTDLCAPKNSIYQLNHRLQITCTFCTRVNHQKKFVDAYSSETTNIN